MSKGLSYSEIDNMPLDDFSLMVECMINYELQKQPESFKKVQVGDVPVSETNYDYSDIFL